MKYLYTFNVARAEIVGIFYIEEPLKERRDRAYNWLNDSLAKGLVNPGLKEDLERVIELEYMEYKRRLEIYEEVRYGS